MRIHCTLHQGGEYTVAMEDTELCLETNKGYPDYHILTEEELVEVVTVAESFEDDDDADDKCTPKPKFNDIRTCLY